MVRVPTPTTPTPGERVPESTVTSPTIPVPESVPPLATVTEHNGTTPVTLRSPLLIVALPKNVLVPLSVAVPDSTFVISPPPEIGLASDKGLAQLISRFVSSSTAPAPSAAVVDLNGPRQDRGGADVGVAAGEHERARAGLVDPACATQDTRHVQSAALYVESRAAR